jgi:hypothetical protein
MVQSAYGYMSKEEENILQSNVIHSVSSLSFKKLHLILTEKVKKRDLK